MWAAKRCKQSRYSAFLRHSRRPHLPATGWYHRRDKSRPPACTNWKWTRGFSGSCRLLRRHVCYRIDQTHSASGRRPSDSAAAHPSNAVVVSTVTNMEYTRRDSRRWGPHQQPVRVVELRLCKISSDIVIRCCRRLLQFFSKTELNWIELSKYARLYERQSIEI